MNPLIDLPGPWQHRYIAANGARFHVADLAPVTEGDTGITRPMVLLLHGFPEFWWAWRHQLPALAAAGYRAVAVDLRGYGGSDKTPRGYDPFTLASDIAGVVKALGEKSAVVVGHGWGGYVAWATAVLHPANVHAVCTVSAPHPLPMLDSMPSSATRVLVSHIAAMQVPMRPERRLSSPRSGFLAGHLRSWSAPGSAFPDEETITRYQAALGLWPAPHCALEYHRWLVRSRFRADGRRFGELMRQRVTQPAYTIFGAADRALPDPASDRSHEHVTGPFGRAVLPGVGHFAPEEQPAAFNRLLLDWLTDL